MFEAATFRDMGDEIELLAASTLRANLVESLSCLDAFAVVNYGKASQVCNP
jgi:hypothetical protein